MVDKITTSDATKPAETAVKAHDGLSPAQAEGLKATDVKAIAPATDTSLPGFSIDKGAQTVTHLDGSAVVFNQSADGTAQVQSIKTFDGHLATPGYGDDGTLSKLTIQPRGEEPYTLSRVGESKFDWIDSRNGDLSVRDIQVHAGPNPATTAEIAMYHEGGGATLFAPEAKVQPDVALKDLRSLFGRGDASPFSSGSGVPFNNADGTHVSIFDPQYSGRAGVFATAEHNGLSAQAEPVAITTKDFRTVSLGFDSAQKGVDGRPLVTSATVNEADGSKFELKRVGDTDQWRDSRTGTFRNLEVDRAIGKNAGSTAEILIKDVNDPAKTLFFNPQSDKPVLTGKATEIVDVGSELRNAPAELEKLLAKGKGVPNDEFLANIYKTLEQSGGTAVRDFSQLTDMHGASLFTKSEELGYAFLRSKGSKIGLGVAAAAGLVAAGKWAFSRHDDAPAPSPTHNLGFTLERQTKFSRGEVLLAPSSRTTELMLKLQDNSKALNTVEPEK